MAEQEKFMKLVCFAMHNLSFSFYSSFFPSFFPPFFPSFFLIFFLSQLLSSFPSSSICLKRIEAIYKKAIHFHTNVKHAFLLFSLRWFGLMKIYCDEKQQKKKKFRSHFMCSILMIWIMDIQMFFETVCCVYHSISVKSKPKMHE